MGEGVEVGVPEDDYFSINYEQEKPAIYSGSATVKRINNDRSVTDVATEVGSIHLFPEQMVNWEFCPPSNNLWTVDIRLHSSGSSPAVHSLLTLYYNIKAALAIYKRTYAAKFNVTVNEAKVNKYLSLLQQNKLNIFLANRITAPSYSVSVEDAPAPNITTHGGFITSGKSIIGRNHSLQCNIQFLQSNYEIGDILFDQWIAALAAQGLIQDPNLPELRADIFLYNYAASHPDHPRISTWVLRKTLILYKAFPIGRGGTVNSYEPGEIGYRNDQVQFKFSDYSIEYHL